MTAILRYPPRGVGTVPQPVIPIPTDPAIIAQINGKLDKAGGIVTGQIISDVPVTALNQLVNKAYADSILVTISGYITGNIIKLPSSVTPTGFLACNGAPLSKTTYANLYAKVGDVFTVKDNIGSGKPWKQQYVINTTQVTDITGWVVGTSLSSVSAFAQAIVTNSRVYLLGGQDSVGAISTVYTATINPDGTLGIWTVGTSLPAALTGTQAIVTKNRVYLIGGYSAGAYLSSVYTAPINVDGTLGTWTIDVSLPVTTGFSQAVVTKSKVYLISGYGTIGANTYTAPVNPDGTIGAWSLSLPLPAQLYTSCAVLTKNRIYMLGGTSTSGFGVTMVYTTVINQDGTLGGWVTDTPLPAALDYSQAIITNSRVYLLGGRVNNVYTSNTYSAPINIDGTLGTWTITPNLPGALGSGQSIVTNSKVYLLGGISTVSATVTVYTAPIAGGVNDYSPYYDGTADALAAITFNLPNLNTTTNNGLYSYIKI